MTTIAEAIAAHMAAHPDFHVVAGDHRYGCTCGHCLAFHAYCGLDFMLGTQAAAVWKALRDEPVGGGDPTVLGLSDDQRDRFMALVEVNL